jgi:hypothetical protein
MRYRTVTSQLDQFIPFRRSQETRTNHADRRIANAHLGKRFFGFSQSRGIEDKKIKKKHAKLTLTDDRNEKIVLEIELLTDTVTRVHFDAGSQEFAGFAHLLARQIVQELKDADAFLVHWSDDTQ